MNYQCVAIIVFIMLLTGCFGDGPQDRRLDIDGQGVVENESGGYNLSVIITASYPGHQPFQNVSVHGFTRDGRLVCQDTVGEIHRTGHEMLTMQCDGFPRVIALDADVSPCQDDVSIEYVVFRDSAEEPRYVEKTRSCGTGLPPKGWRTVTAD